MSGIKDEEGLFDDDNNFSKINSHYFIMKELLILIVGIIAFSLLVIKKNNKHFLELFQNPKQVKLDNVEDNKRRQNFRINFQSFFKFRIL